LGAEAFLHESQFVNNNNVLRIPKEEILADENVSK
jgi:hypothetical protein